MAQGHRVVVYAEDPRGKSGCAFNCFREEGAEYWVLHHRKRNIWVAWADHLLKHWLGRRFFTSAVAVFRFIGANRDVDCFFVEGDWIGIFVAFAHSFMNFRWVVTIHDTLNLPMATHYSGREEVPWKRWLKCWVIGRADRVRANSFLTRDALMGAGCEAERISVVPLHIGGHLLVSPPQALDLYRERCRAELRSRYGLPEGARLLVTMSRLTPIKGLELAVEALAVLARQGDNSSHLLICGADRKIRGLGSYREHLERLAGGFGLSSRIHFSGHLDRMGVMEHLAAADAHLAPSVFDTFNLAALEAALMGTYSILSETTGIAPWLAELMAARVANGRRAEDWARCILDLGAGAETDAQGMRERCLARFSADAVARQLVALVPY